MDVLLQEDEPHDQSDQSDDDSAEHDGEQSHRCLLASVQVRGYNRRMAKRKCGYCGNVPDGFAKVNDVWLCHPDDLDKPDCYSLYQSRVSGEVVMRNDAHGNLVFWAEAGSSVSGSS